MNYLTDSVDEQGTASSELYNELRASYPEHLPLYIARLQALESEKEKNLKEIIDTATTALKNIDVAELLEYYGMKSDTRKDASKIKRFSLHTIF